MVAFGRFRTRHGAEVLASGPVFDIQDEAPNNVRGETAEENHGQFGQAREPLNGAGLKRGFIHRAAGNEAEIETGAHDSRKRGDEHSFGETELGNGLPLFGF